jgi:pimeloyl-ACP methyl ester carboxylesterase
MDDLNLYGNQELPNSVSGLEKIGTGDSMGTNVNPLQANQPNLGTHPQQIPVINESQEIPSPVIWTGQWSSIFGWQFESHQIDYPVSPLLLTGSNTHNAPPLFSVTDRNDYLIGNPENIGLSSVQSQADTVSTILQHDVYLTLQQIAKSSNFQQLMQSIFGSDIKLEKLNELGDSWQKGNFSTLPPIEVRDELVFSTTTMGVFAGQIDKIYLSQKLLAHGKSEEIADTILEEIGHWLDKQLNQVDTKGDEGQLFVAVIRGKQLSPDQIAEIRAEDDITTIFVDSQYLTVEQSASDLAGNTLATARNIGNLGSTEQTYSDFVGTGDTADYYQFTLTKASQVNLNLGNLSADANVQLLNQWGSLLQGSYNTGTTAETINPILAAGTYYLNVYPGANSNTNYNFKVKATEIIDSAGNTIAAAKNIGVLNSNTQTINDLVGDIDPADYYQFNLTNTSTINLNLSGLTTDANVQILNSNGGGLVGSYNGGTNAETISTTLNAGNYYAYVYRAGSGNTNYSLNLSAVPDNAGSSLNTARNIGNLGSTEQTYSDFVGTGDTADYYQFTLTKASQVNLNLGNLSADANVQLLNQWGSLLQGSYNTGTTAETINPILAAGTYYLNVYPGANSNTNYNFKVKATEIIDSAGNTIAAAKNIGVLNSNTQTINDLVGDIDPADYYQFNLTNTSTINLNLSGLTTDANVQILNSNGGGLVGSYNGGTNAETISTTLNAGNYYAYVYRAGSGNTNYSLNLSAVPDNAGSSLNTARNIGNLGSTEQTYSDFVGTGDTADYYQFTLTKASQVNLNLGNLSADANVQLLNQWGSLLQGSYNTGTTAETINPILAAGTYYLNVYPGANSNTNYNFKVKATEIIDSAGNTIAAAKNIGVLNSNTQTINDLVGDIDPADYYQFNLTNTSTINLNLSGLTTDANVQILNSNGGGLVGSYNGGTNAETISTTLNAGNYYAYVYRAGSGNTNYSLNLSAVPDNAGSSLNTARNIGNLGSTEQTYSDFVGTGDTADYYQFTLTKASQVNLNLGNLSADANVQLLNQWGSLLQGSYNTGTTAETINPILAAGTYYLNVYPGANSNTNYNFKVKATEIIDSAGNTIAAAKNIGVLNSNTQTINDLVGDIDPADYYQFNLTNTSTINLNLSGLTTDANVQILNSNGGGLVGSYNGGTNAETISTTLNAGNYYAYVYRAGSGNTNYSLNLSAVPDNAGSSLNTARNIGNLGSTEQTYSDFVGTGDTADYYQFTLTKASQVNLNLGNLSADANVQLLNQWGSLLQGSYNTGTTAETINPILAAGTYYLNVYPGANSNTNYNFKVKATEIIDSAGNTIAAAKNIGVLNSNTQTINDLVGDIDPADYYQFNLTNTSTINLNLSGLTTDANVQILNSNGGGLVGSYNGGTNAETISTTLNAGNYYAYVYRAGSGNTNYSLNLSAVPDNAGSSLNTARNIGNLGSTEQTYSDFVGTGDTADYYQFTLTKASQVNLNLGNLSADANVQLLNQWGSLLQGSYNTGTTAETINPILAAGTYYLNVYPGANSNTNYNFKVKATEIIDSAGNTIAAAKNIGVLNSNTQTINDLVGDIDPADYYQFNLTNTSTINLNLSGLTTDANVQILNSNGGGLVGSYNGGTNAETISTTLNAGNYYAYVYRAGSGNTNYSLNLSAVPDNAGSSLNTARNIGNLGSTEQTYSDFVGDADIFDYYQFNVSTFSNVNLVLDGLNANANMQLLNGNGSFIQASYNPGNAADKINYNLNPGNYYLNVYREAAGANTNYKLSVSAIPDYAGNTTSAARTISLSSTTSTFSDFVGDVDTYDYYKFDVTSYSKVNFQLDGLSDNANLQLLDSSGKFIQGSYNTNNVADNITYELDEGTYFVGVYREAAGNNTNYNLSVNATYIPLPDKAGNNRSEARNLGVLTTLQSFKDFVGDNDKDDFYTFYVAEPGTANISLTNLSQSSRVEFFRASNIYSDFSGSSGYPSFSTKAYIDTPGQYYLRVAQDFGAKDTNYTLALSTTSSVVDLGSLNGTRSITGNNNIGYYRFKLDQNSVVKASSNFPDMIGLRVQDSSYKNTVGLWLDKGVTLNAGTYYLAVSNIPGSVIPSSFTLNLQTTPTNRYDNAGLDAITALDLGAITSSKSVTDFIDLTDKRDYYSFTVDSKSSVSLNVSPITGSAKVNVTLYNGKYDYLTAVYGNSGTPKPLVATLDAGKYYVLINDAISVPDVQYRLDVNVQSLTANDAIGNTFAQAKDLGEIYPSSPIATVKDAIGGDDAADWFRFSMGKLGNLLPVLDGLTTPVSLQLMRIESNGALTSLGTSNSNGQSNWTPAFNNLTVGNYALALTSNSTTSTPYTLNLSTVSTNVAPTDLKISFNNSYTTNQDVIVTGTVFDANGATDIDDVWVSINGQQTAITNFTKTFTPSSQDNRLASFSLNFGKLPVGTYTWSASASDKSREGSGGTISVNGFTVQAAPSTGGTTIILQPSGSTTNWQTQYFTGQNLSGSPVYTESLNNPSNGSNRLNFAYYWGENAPNSYVSKDNFSVRVKGENYFTSGQYKVTVKADDGIRVRVNGQTIIDKWVDQEMKFVHTGTFSTNGGNVPIEVDYYENGGYAGLDFLIEKTSDSATTNSNSNTNSYSNTSPWQIAIDNEYSYINNQPRGYNGDIIRLGNAVTGYEVAATSPYGTTGYWRGYENGVIHSSKYGTVSMWNDFKKLYTGSGSSLGFPTQDEYDWKGGRRLDFEGGYMYWSPGKDAKIYNFNELPDSSSNSTSLPPSTYRITEPVNEAQEWKANLFNWNRNSGSIPPVDFFNGDSSNPNWLGTLNLGSNNENGNKSGSLKFGWGTGTVKGNSQLPADGFAIRAYTWADFDGSKYQFNVRADDGFQLLAKNQSTGQWFYITPQNQWQTSGYGTPSTLSYALPAGRYDLHFHYFENGGEAKMDLSWNKVESTSNSPTTSTSSTNNSIFPQPDFTLPVYRENIGYTSQSENITAEGKSFDVKLKTTERLVPQLYPMQEREVIRPSASNTWVIVHGLNDNPYFDRSNQNPPNGSNIYNLATGIEQIIKGQWSNLKTIISPNDQVLVVDWSDGALAEENGYPSLKNFPLDYDIVASRVDEVGASVARMILKAGINPKTVNFIGHSLGSYVSAYAAKALGGVNTLTVLDPATEFDKSDVRGVRGNSKPIDALNNAPRFDSVATFSTQFSTTNLFGTSKTTAHESYWVDLAGENALVDHGEAVRWFIDNLRLPVIPNFPLLGESSRLALNGKKISFVPTTIWGAGISYAEDTKIEQVDGWEGTILAESYQSGQYKGWLTSQTTLWKGKIDRDDVKNLSPKPPMA